LAEGLIRIVERDGSWLPRENSLTGKKESIRKGPLKTVKITATSDRVDGMIRGEMNQID
jgi:hypothetical protein